MNGGKRLGTREKGTFLDGEEVKGGGAGVGSWGGGFWNRKRGGSPNCLW